MASERELRFAVVRDDGAASEPWHLWTSKAGDAYVAIRALGGQAKVSLHASGDWRYGFTAENPGGESSRAGNHTRRDVVVRKVAGGGVPISERVIRQWRRPEPSSAGYVVAVRLVVPLVSCTRTPMPSTPKKPIHYVPVAPDTPTSMMVTFTVVLSAADERTGYPRPDDCVPSTLVDTLPLGSDQRLWLVASLDPLNQSVMEAAVEHFADFLDLADNEEFLTSDRARLAVFGHLEDENETPFMADLDPLLAVGAWIKWLDDHGGSATDKERGLRLGMAIAKSRGE